MRLSEALAKKTYRQRKIQHPPDTVLVVEIPISRRNVEELPEELSTYGDLDVTIDQLLTQYRTQVLKYYEMLIQEQRDGDYNPDDHGDFILSIEWLADLIRAA